MMTLMMMWTLVVMTMIFYMKCVMVWVGRSEPVGPHGGLLPQEEEAIAALLTFSISERRDCPPTEK